MRLALLRSILLHPPARPPFDNVLPHSRRQPELAAPADALTSRAQSRTNRCARAQRIRIAPALARKQRCAPSGRLLIPSQFGPAGPADVDIKAGSCGDRLLCSRPGSRRALPPPQPAPPPDYSSEPRSPPPAPPPPGPPPHSQTVAIKSKQLFTPKWCAFPRRPGLTRSRSASAPGSGRAAL